MENVINTNTNEKMINKIKNNKALILAVAVAVAHFIVTFFTDKMIFNVAPSAGFSDYIICKIICLIVLLYMYYGIFNAFFFGGKKDSVLRNVLISALPYLIVLLAVLAIKLPAGYISNDETLIFDAAVNLEHYTWFYYITTYYYIVSLMIIPVSVSPIIVKVIIEYLVIGYVVYRSKKYFGKPYGYFSFILFLLYPVIAYTTSAHRLPIYYLLYLFIMSKLLFDKLEKADITKHGMFWLLVLSSVLTQWRTEGIYFAVLSIILILFVYPVYRNKKNLVLLIASSLIIQYAVSIPQNGIVADNLEAAADDRMKPFYAYTITNMFRCGLDRDKNAEDLAIVDKYLSIEVIDAINEYYEDINYEDVLILYQPGYVGVREEADATDFFNYAAALKRIFMSNPDVFFKTRVGAFCYAALPFHITMEGGGIGALVKLGISIVKTVSYNLFIPLAIVVLLCLYSLIKRKWYTFFVMGGLLAHWFIVFVLAPASYFKYYFPIYIMAYFYVIMIAINSVKNRKQKEKNAICE